MNEDEMPRSELKRDGTYPGLEVSVLSTVEGEPGADLALRGVEVCV